MIAALALFRRFWPILAVIAVVIAVTVWGNGREADGVAKERAAWEAEASRLRTIAAEQALQRQAAVDRAETADSERAAMLGRLLAPIDVKVTAYEKSERGRAVCLDDDGRLLARQAIAAANASIASGSATSGRTVPGSTE